MDHRHDYDIDDRHAYLVGIAVRKRSKPRVGRHDRRELTQAFRSFPLTASMTPAQLDSLVEFSHAFSFPANWTVQQQSGISDICLLISEGEIRFVHNGTETGTAGPGAVLGLGDAVEHHVHHDAAVSTTRVRGIAVDAEVLLAALASRPMHAAASQILVTAMKGRATAGVTSRATAPSL